MKIVSSAQMSEKHRVELKKRYPEADFYFFENMNQAVEDLKTADVLITYGLDLTKEIVNQCTHLKWIQVISAGINELPLDIINEKKILLTNAKGIHHIQMSEYTIGVIFQLSRKMNEIYKNQLKKKWEVIRFSEMYGSTIGIVGLGSIGQGIAEKAKAFNMKVIGMNTDGRAVPYVDKVFKPNQLKELMAESDYVVIIVPLTPDTYHLIGQEELHAMKETAYIINIARGEVIDEEALISKLKNKEIAGAVLDVFSKEPLPEDHPFWTLDNCIITPHLSGKSPNYLKRAIELLMYNMDYYRKNEISKMKNVVDSDKRY